MADPKTHPIEIFRPGTFTTRSGDEVTFSVADLQQIAQRYDPEKKAAPGLFSRMASVPLPWCTSKSNTATRLAPVASASRAAIATLFR